MTSSQRPTATATGLLSKRPFLHLVLYAAERRLTGTMEFVTPDGATSMVVFADGDPTRVKTAKPVAYLGRVLLELGILDDESLNRSLVLFAEERGLHGALLLRHEMITATELAAGLHEQLMRKLHSLGELPGETTFAYYDGWDGLVGYGGTEVVTADPFRVVAGLTREFAPEEHLQQTLAKVAGGALRIAPHADLSRFAFTEGELPVLELLRTRGVALGDLISGSPTPEKIVRQVVYLLLITRQLEVISRDGPTSSRARVSSNRWSAPPPAVEKAPSVSSQTRVASETRSSPPPSAEVSRVTPDPEVSPLPAPAPVAAVRNPSVPQAKAAPPMPDVEARRREIVERAVNIDKEDYFTMLGLTHAATTDDAKRAYLALAKVWHPDRLPAALADLRAECSKVFARLSDAHHALSDVQSRTHYVALLRDGGATPEEMETIAAVIEAATNFQKAEVFFKRNDLQQAEVFCRLARTADPKQADYLALLTWLEAMKPEGQSPQATKTHIATLTEAIAMNARCERAYYFRGLLLKRMGNQAAAVRDFKEVVELNPRHIDAAREVRLAAKRASYPPPPPAPDSDRRSTPPGRPSQAPPANRSSDAPPKSGGSRLLEKFWKRDK